MHNKENADYLEFSWTYLFSAKSYSVVHRSINLFSPTC